MKPKWEQITNKFIDNLSKSDVPKHTSPDRLVHRPYRRVMALFRAGSLPLAIETGRYARPPVPVENRLCIVCNKNCVETEKHFLLDCPLYDDMRLILFYNVHSLLKVLTV